MEKFAVDLEKVLDEFEYNEERQENVSTPIKHPSSGLGTLIQASSRPPAASYRRPAFEPINLSDADFGVSLAPSVPSFNAELSEENNDSDDTFSYIKTNCVPNNKNYIHSNNTIVSSLKNDVNINRHIIREPESSLAWPTATSSGTSEEKPDLLEYNLKNIDLASDELDIHSQLPDLTTSVRICNHGVNNNEVDNASNSLDLISSASGSFIPVCEETVNSFTNSDSLKSETSDLLTTNSTRHSSNLLEEPMLLDGQDQKYLVLNNESTEADATLYSSIDTALKCSNSVQNETNAKKEEITENDYFDSNGDLEINNENCINESRDPINKSLFLKNDQPTITYHSTEKESVLENNETNMIIPKDDAVIGFSYDSDLSESEYEEYFKELENLEESVLSIKDNVHRNTKLIAEQQQHSLINDNGYENSNNTVSSLAEEEMPACENQTNNEKPFDFNSDSEPNDKFCLKDDAETTCLKDDVEKMCVIENIPSHAYCSEQSSTIEKPLSLQSYISFSQSASSQSTQFKYESDRAFVDIKDETNSMERIVRMESQIPSESKPKDEPQVLSKDSDEGFNEDEEGIISSPEARSKSSNPFYEVDSNNVEEIIQVKCTNPFEEEEDDDSSSMEECRKQSVPISCKYENNSDNQDSTVLNKVGENSLESTVIDNTNLTLNLKLQSDSSPNTNQQESVTSKNTDASLNSSSEVTNNDSAVPQTNVSTDSVPSCSIEHTELHNDSLEQQLDADKPIVINETSELQNVDESEIAAEEEKPPRPNSLELPRKITVETNAPQSPVSGSSETESELRPDDQRLGKIPPFWIPDADTTMCMQCQQKFSMIKRRHHCRGCGQVLCHKCCSLRARLEYMNFTEARVCQPCFTVLQAVSASEPTSPLRRQPNPNNPMEYCSTIPPLQQAAGSLHQPPPSVMVPVGVLKREGRSNKSEVTKQVMFSDGIRPGGDLTELDGSAEPRMPFRRPGRLMKRVGTPPGGAFSPSMRRMLDPTTQSFIPVEGDTSLPPTVCRVQGQVSYTDLESPVDLNQPTLKFAINRNLFVNVKRVVLDCCVNKECWCFSSEGLACVGQDEVVFLLECLPQETLPPKDVFLLINFLYQDAAKGSTVSEMSFTPAMSNNLLGSRDHGGFLYIRTSYQCTAQLVLPPPPYLVALLIHRWETPWARLFPLRLVLRLGAEFRYYPCPLVSVRNRTPLYTDIGHTIINLLADFRKYSYTLPSVRGLVIHMEDRQTTINIPRNRYDQVVRALNNSNDSVLAFGANLSLAADSHLVCMQSAEDENTAYHTQAININNKPRRVTGASFVVFNGALKVPGLAGKSNIVEDGLMVQVPSETMIALRSSLRDMKDYTIGCGPAAEETVLLQWTADDTNFNIGVKSFIDGKPLDGVPSIRVHNGTDYTGGSRIIRWTEVFILQCEDSEHSSEPLDISRLSESIARATCLALVPLLDLLSAAALTTLAVRTTIHPDNVGYEAGSNGEKLPPLYMKSLDDELIAVVHQAALSSQDNPAVLELVFRIMEQG